MNPRPYQEEGIVNSVTALEEVRSAVGVAATGMGKTIMFSHHAARRIKATSGRAIIVAHREELVMQAKEKVHAVTGIMPDVEMAEYRADRAFMFVSPIIVASVQTLGHRLGKFKPGDFSDVIIDEAQHAVAESYGCILDHFSQSKVFGVTATPDRSDEVALGRVFDRAAFDFDIDYGINESWLVPIRPQLVRVESIDFASIRSRNSDLVGTELAKLMEAEKPLHGVVNAVLELAHKLRCLVFACSVPHAEKMAEIFNRHKPGSARSVSGKTPKDERREIVRAHKAGEFQYLVNCNVFTEGYDDPGIECVVMARPTESRSLYAQMLGRGTRPAAPVDLCHYDAGARKRMVAASSKPHLLVLDFVDNSGVHQLVSTIDILAGDYEKEVIASVKARAERGDIDVAVELDMAKAEQARIFQEMQHARRSELIAKASYVVEDVDPFKVLGVRRIHTRAWERNGRQLSPAMVASLTAEGIPHPENLGYAAAKKVFSEILTRKYQHRPSFKQEAFFHTIGETTPKTAAEAARQIEHIKASVVPTRRPIPAFPKVSVMS